MKYILACAALTAMSSAVSAADLAAHPYTKAPIVSPAPSWTGFYIGGNLGGAWGSSDPRTSTIFVPFGGYLPSGAVDAIGVAGSQHVSNSGVTGGLTVGHNWQVGKAVFGLEDDINYFGLKGSATTTAPYFPGPSSLFTVSSSVSADWLATIRARVGFLATPSWLIYGTGGAAIAGMRANFNFSDNFAAAQESAAINNTRVGWTAGVGTEHAIGGGWSLKAEYLHIDLGRMTTTSTNLNVLGGIQTFPAQVFTHSADLTSEVVRIGFNYRFNGAAAANY